MQSFFFIRYSNLYTLADELFYRIRPMKGGGEPRDAATAMFRSLETFEAEARTDPGITRVRRYEYKIDQNSLNSM